ncbi:helix-turn-helix domain-containing protein [Parablastomonas sp. CN1-191]|uniref:helix-turn-helix domain-containing protein n=1 Tax=Parablastomonas sp. CN1-191 TaxID=3400908 RepID=UPI003BF852CC
MDEELSELPLDGVGAQLVRARKKAKLSRAEVAERTKIPERHLEAIEDGRFGALPARTYAVGFSRSYARAVGADEAAIVEQVRRELAFGDPDAQRRAPSGFEPGDPSRVSSAKFAWLSGLAALIVVVIGLLWYNRAVVPAGSLPSILPAETAAPAQPLPASAAPAAPAAAATTPVVFTADGPAWVRFTDAKGTKLLEKELTIGETFTVPEGAGEVFLRTAHPEALSITVGGQPVPRIADVQKTVSQVPVTGPALLARTAPGAPGAASAAPTAPAAAPSASNPATPLPPPN